MRAPENEYRENGREKIIKERKKRGQMSGAYKNYKLGPPLKYIPVKV